jgi:hypothetical protein
MRLSLAVGRSCSHSIDPSQAVPSHRCATTPFSPLLQGARVLHPVMLFNL